MNLDAFRPKGYRLDKLFFGVLLCSPSRGGELMKWFIVVVKKPMTLGFPHVVKRQRSNPLCMEQKKRPGGQVVTAAHFPGEFFEYKLLPPVLFSRRLATQHMEHQGVQTPKLCHSLLLALCCSQHGDNGWYTSPPS